VKTKKRRLDSESEPAHPKPKKSLGQAKICSEKVWAKNDPACLIGPAKWGAPAELYIVIVSYWLRPPGVINCVCVSPFNNVQCLNLTTLLHTLT
jgi:hypothetical protein